jgi:hypothetical protein
MPLASTLLAGAGVPGEETPTEVTPSDARRKAEGELTGVEEASADSASRDSDNDPPLARGLLLV